MARIEISVMQWGRLPDLRDVAPLADADLDCMQEVRDVLARHGCLGRFALHLVHRHFEIADGEVLVEYGNPTTRELQLRVEPRRSAALLDAVPTTWTLDAGGPQVVCLCASRPGLGHLGRHAPPQRP